MRPNAACPRTPREAFGIPTFHCCLEYYLFPLLKKWGRDVGNPSCVKWSSMDQGAPAGGRSRLAPACPRVPGAPGLSFPS